MISPAMEDAIDVAAGKVAGWSIFDGKAGKQIALLKSGTVVGTTRGKVVSELYKAAADTAGVTLMLGHKLIKGRHVLSHAHLCESFGRGGRGRLLGLRHACPRLHRMLLQASHGVASTDPTFAVAATPWEISFRCLFTSDPPKATTSIPRYTTSSPRPASTPPFSPARVGSSTLSVNPTMGLGDMKWLLEETATDENIARLKAHIAHTPAASGRDARGRGVQGILHAAIVHWAGHRLNRLNHSRRRLPSSATRHAGEGTASHAFTPNHSLLSSANISLLTLPLLLLTHTLSATLSHPHPAATLSRPHPSAATLSYALIAVIPSTGEGINAALEDVGVLLDARTANDGWFAQIQPRAARRRERAVRLGGVSP